MYIVVAVELITSVEALVAAMLTCSQSNIRSHSHQFNYLSLHTFIHHPSIDASIHPSIHPYKIQVFFARIMLPTSEAKLQILYVFFNHQFFGIIFFFTFYSYRTPEMGC